MLKAILNVEQARSSNVKRDQPNPKFDSNWNFIIDFIRSPMVRKYQKTGQGP
jgi:hypothetical protein